MITLTGVKRGYNRIDFPNVIVLSNNQYLSVGAAENLDYTNECTFGYLLEKEKEQADEVLGIFQLYNNNNILTTQVGNLYGLYTDYDDHEIYCPTEAEKKGGLGRMANKSISFIGDSITTFSGFIPTANAVYYPNAGITRVNQTYWMRCLGKMKMRLFTNEAWSGSRLTGTSASAAVSESRWNNLRSTGNTGEDPDYIVIHISTNDWTGNVELGDYDFTDSADKTKLKSAWCYLIRKLQQTYKKSQIYICTLLFRQQWTDHEYLHANSAGQTIQDYNEVIREVAKIFGLHLIELDRCGFNAFNFTNGQYPGSDNQYSNNDGLHPNYEGAKIVAEFMDEYLFNR